MITSHHIINVWMTHRTCLAHSRPIPAHIQRYGFWLLTPSLPKLMRRRPIQESINAKISWVLMFVWLLWLERFVQSTIFSFFFFVKHTEPFWDPYVLNPLMTSIYKRWTMMRKKAFWGNTIWKWDCSRREMNKVKTSSSHISVQAFGSFDVGNKLILKYMYKHHLGQPKVFSLL